MRDHKPDIAGPDLAAHRHMWPTVDPSRRSESASLLTAMTPATDPHLTCSFPISTNTNSMSGCPTPPLTLTSTHGQSGPLWSQVQPAYLLPDACNRFWSLQSNYVACEVGRSKYTYSPTQSSAVRHHRGIMPNNQDSTAEYLVSRSYQVPLAAPSAPQPQPETQHHLLPKHTTTSILAFPLFSP